MPFNRQKSFIELRITLFCGVLIVDTINPRGDIVYRRHCLWYFLDISFKQKLKQYSTCPSTCQRSARTTGRLQSFQPFPSFILSQYMHGTFSDQYMGVSKRPYFGARHKTCSGHDFMPLYVSKPINQASEHGWSGCGRDTDIQARCCESHP